MAEQSQGVSIAAFSSPVNVAGGSQLGLYISGNRVYQELESAQQLSALHELVLSLNEVSQICNSYNVLCLLVYIDEPQLTILPFGGQIDPHQHSETKTIQVGHFF